MKFRTEYIPSPASFSLDPRLPVVMAGSCFSQNIAARMIQHEWKAVNPLSTLYNPVSILKALEIMLDRESGSKLFDESLFYYNGIWNSHYFDSSFSSHEAENCREEFRIRQQELLGALEEGETLIVTFGTAICYHLQSSDEIVGNCHKQPANLFYRKRLTTEEIRGMWSDFLKNLKKRYPEIRVIFTVSPVRHLKDGFEGNLRSKAILLLAVEEIVNSDPSTTYFPAYEILNDDLRDYRFYASDLVHPSEEAIDYVWEKFVETFIDSEGRIYLKEGLSRYKSINHHPKTGALSLPLS